MFQLTDSEETGSKATPSAHGDNKKFAAGHTNTHDMEQLQGLCLDEAEEAQDKIHINPAKAHLL